MANIVHLKRGNPNRVLALHAALERLRAEAMAQGLDTTGAALDAAADCLLTEAALEARQPAEREALLSLRRARSRGGAR